MPREVSPEAFRAAYSRESSDTFLELITITHPDIEDVIRVALDTQAVTSNGEEYAAFPFTVELMDQVPDQLPMAKLDISNVDLRVGQAVRMILPKPNVEYRLVLRSQPDTVEMGPIPFLAPTAVYDKNTVSVTLAIDLRLLTEPHPFLTVNPQTCPGAF